MSSWSGHADEILATLNTLIKRDQANIAKVTAEITGNPADMLINLAASAGWTMSQTVAYLLDQVGQQAERGLAIHDGAEPPNTAGYSVQAEAWTKGLMRGDFVLSGMGDVSRVIRLYADGPLPMIEVVVDWNTLEDGDFWFDDDCIEGYQQADVKPLTQAEVQRWLKAGLNGEDFDEVLADLRRAHS